MKHLQIALVRCRAGAEGMEVYAVGESLVWSIWDGERILHFVMKPAMARKMRDVLGCWLDGPWPPPGPESDLFEVKHTHKGPHSWARHELLERVRALGRRKR